MLKKLPPLEGNVQQTWVKMYVNMACNNGLTQRVIKQDVRSLAKYFLEVTSSMRKRFDRSQDIDARNMLKIVTLIKQTPVTAEGETMIVGW